MTNADQLREMDDDELASFLCSDGICPPDVFIGECAARDNKNLNCHDCWLIWLRKEAD